jgi:hypothetical protein
VPAMHGSKKGVGGTVTGRSNGVNSDGSLMNVGNKFGARPSIRLFTQYSSSSQMEQALSDDWIYGAGEPQRTSHHQGSAYKKRAVAPASGAIGQWPSADQRALTEQHWPAAQPLNQHREAATLGGRDHDDAGSTGLTPRARQLHLGPRAESLLPLDATPPHRRQRRTRSSSTAAGAA